MLGFSLGDWTKEKFFDWVDGWKASWEITKANGQSTAKIDSGDLLTDILIITCIVGVLMTMAGIKKGNKLILGSILAALIGRVIFHAG